MDKVLTQGLTSQQAEEKLKLVGKNEIVTKKTGSPVFLFLSQFPTVLNTILAIAAFFSFLVSDVIDGMFILTILLINGIFGFIQEYRAEKSLEKLKDFITPLSRVIRDGKEIQIPSPFLVPGDLVILSEGERLPTDGKITHALHHLEIDESILTGESLPVIKRLNDPVFSGTLITKGSGHLLVEKTGMNTSFGQIAQTLSTIETDKTPLQLRLDHLGKVISIIAITVAILIIPMGISQGKNLLPLVFLAISISIAAIPEGLPAVVTIALAIGTSRMAKKNAIVRKMPAVETLGAVQVILIDKTGTLTQNAMRVKKFWTRDDEALSSILQACVLGNTASLIQKLGKNDFDIVGDKTDGALLLWAHHQLKDIKQIKNSGKITDEYEFDPDTKTITTVWETQNKAYVFVRGAPEEILAKSKISKEEKEKITRGFEAYAKEGLRVIGFGEKTRNAEDIERNHLETNLNFLGFIGIYDPPRLEARQAVENAKKAGIRTIMVTGDNELTALTIAKEVNLIEKDEDVVTGEELDKLSDDELHKILGRVRIFARTKPEHKLRLVSLFKKQGLIVGVTGDGVNDALALKRADVGIAMGETGTDVAVEASDIVLADDNFSTLVKAVEEGRVIYANILKSITYLLSGNLAELSLVFFAAAFNLPSPLLPTQILWINMITDGLPALALASDNKNPHILKEEPRDPKDPILNKKHVTFISLVGLGLAFLLLLIFKQLLPIISETQARTVVFNLLIFFHLIIVFVVRGKAPLLGNKFLIFSVVLTVILQVIISTTPFFQSIFHLGL